MKASEKLLKKLGLNPGKIDGLFDARTKKAVLAFEKKHHLTQDGKNSAGELAKMKQLAKTTAGIHVTATMRRAGERGEVDGAVDGRLLRPGLVRDGRQPLHREGHGHQGVGQRQPDRQQPARSKFRQVHSSLKDALTSPGLILTWEHTSTRLGSIYGHAAITLGNGSSSAGDFVERNTLAAGGRTGLKIFVPIG
ncbi:MAG: peptidoglycan-binding domain-containing protein [Myxococcota bacterium]